MHLNPFKAILDQVFFMREAEFFLGNESGGSEEEYANLQYMPYKHNIWLLNRLLYNRQTYFYTKKRTRLWNTKIIKARHWAGGGRAAGGGWARHRGHGPTLGRGWRVRGQAVGPSSASPQHLPILHPPASRPVQYLRRLNLNREDYNLVMMMWTVRQNYGKNFLQIKSFIQNKLRHICTELDLYEGFSFSY